MAVADARSFQRRVRKQLSGPAGSANIAADVNVVASSSAGTSTKQSVRIVQRGRTAAGARPAQGDGSDKIEEDE